MDSDLFCRYCERHFFSQYNLHHHLQTAHRTVASSEEKSQPLSPSFVCDVCNRQFGRKDNLRRHVESCHGERTMVKNAFRCGLCPASFTKFFTSTNTARESMNVTTISKKWSPPTAGRRCCGEDTFLITSRLWTRL